MAVLSYPVRNSSNILTANNGVKVEFFPTYTYATAAASSTRTHTVADRAGFSDGDIFYVGTVEDSSGNTLTPALSSGGGNTGPGTLTFNVAFSLANNDTLCVKRKTGEGSDNYLAVYDSPLRDTTISQPIPASSDNEVRVFAAPGYAAVRWSDSSGNTLDLDHDVKIGDFELDWVYVTPDHDSTSAGINEAILKLPAAGGTIYLGPGTFTVENRVKITNNVRLIGSGIYTTTVKRADSTDAAFAGGVVRFETSQSNMALSDLTVDGNIAGNNAAADTLSGNIFGRQVTNVLVERVRSIQATRAGIQFDSNVDGTRCANIDIFDCIVDDCGQYGIEVDNAENVNIRGCFVKRTADNGIGLTWGGRNATTTHCRYVRVENNYVNRSSAPTEVYNGITLVGTQTGRAFLINAQGASSSVISNNIFWDNSLTRESATSGGDDGIGGGSPAKGQGGWKAADNIISNNLVYKSGAFGIDVGHRSVCVGNIVLNSGSHGIVIPGDNNPKFSHMTVSDNIILDSNDANTSANVYAIWVGGMDGNTTATTGATYSHVKIHNNQVKDKRVPRRSRGILVHYNTKDTFNSVITNLSIKDNDLKNISDASIFCSGTTGNLVSPFVVQGNQTQEAWEGLTYLTNNGAAGGTRTGTRTVTNTRLPKLQMYVECSRASFNSSVSTAYGHLEAVHATTAQTVTITARKADDTGVETNDASGIFWRVAGTLDAVTA